MTLQTYILAMLNLPQEPLGKGIGARDAARAKDGEEVFFTLEAISTEDPPNAQQVQHKSLPSKMVAGDTRHASFIHSFTPVPRARSDPTQGFNLSSLYNINMYVTS